MALELHDDCVTRMKAVLVRVLQEAVVEQGVLLAWESYDLFSQLDNVLPKKGAVRDTLERYIGESPLSLFFRTMVTATLFQEGRFDVNALKRPLTGVPYFSDAATVAEQMIKSLQSLPWRYAIFFPMSPYLSSTLGMHGTDVFLSDRLTVLLSGEHLEKAYPVPATTTTSLLGTPLIKKPWEAGRAYLKVDVDGFISSHIIANPQAAAVSMLKAFYGLGIAHNCMYAQSSVPSSPGKTFLVHQLVEDKWRYQFTGVLDQGWSSALDSLSPILHRDSTLDDWIARLKFFASTLEQSKSRALALASEWFFDGRTERDSLFSFIKAAIVCEILLGDTSELEDKIGTTELLANRCAYLIARSLGERQALMSRFRQIYRVRSKIVHSGKSSLSSEDRLLLHDLLAICSRVIEAETKHLHGS